MSPVSVIFLVFNRPTVAARTFARIREARPARLFVVADGPRLDHPEDAENCRLVRETIEGGVDWPCKVVRDYSAVNLGSGHRVASGISKAFQEVEEAVVLEDDCCPDPTFFHFCSELLERYRDEPQVGLISGSNHEARAVARSDSYFFCRYGNTWGWATWRRAWQKFDLAMRDWPRWRDGGGLKQMFPRREVQRFWRWTWNDAAAGRADIWDYQWTYCYLRHGMLGILPRAPMIENIGFGEDATHTTDGMGDWMPVEPMRFPLQHPAQIVPDLMAEDRAASRFFSRPSWPIRLLRRLRSRTGRVMRRGRDW